MLFVLPILSSVIAPIVLLLVWMVCLWRLKSITLLALTITVGIVVALSTDLNWLLLTRNPYALLTGLMLVIFNVLVLGYLRETDRPYLIIADSILLVMLGALHLWRMYLKQSDGYFTDESTFVSSLISLIIVTLTLTIPVIAWVSRSHYLRGFRWGLVVVGLCVISSIGCSLWLKI
ncbi:MAG: hypothetical protein AAFV93_24150 [Chloroflexota bacterium]